MRGQKLSTFFKGVASKRLAAVEVDPSLSNEHEFNGVTALKKVFGEVAGDEKHKYPARFVRMSDDEERNLSADGQITWYDARWKHPTRSEYRLYYSDNEVVPAANAGDLLVIARLEDDTVLLLMVEAGSTIERQIVWLFGLPEIDQSELFAQSFIASSDVALDSVRSRVLEMIGLETDLTDDDYLDRIRTTFGETFPTTKEFSVFARESVGEVDALNHPDETLLLWMEREELLFRTFEKYQVEHQIREGFQSVDDFVSYSLGLHNRRKSRAGHALENHLEAIFVGNAITYSRGAITEKSSRPDFVFPGIYAYEDETFPEKGLLMLGAKSSCKDRWRQVLAEAKRIHEKHLLTLEPGISPAQTSEMRENNLRLVVPSALHGSYLSSQRDWLMSLQDFLHVARHNQVDCPPFLLRP